ncbi:DUF6252 family protein [Flavobacterium sp.]|uniref:DUF6252 family protein n=1 Tax=Flavobacterium sp. TaxID=239 RepID=UPI002639EA49|nr:DUF6252 family protein [Flavobacterium sp.]
MKKLILLLLTTFIFSCCNKDDDQPKAEIDKLPPATQVGANTFGCLLDGVAFKPGGGPNPLDCVYQYVNGGYYFALQGNKRDSNNNLLSVSLGTINLQIFENNTYQLKEQQDGNARGRFYLNTLYNDTSQIYTGELTITKLDQVNKIVSGTFWFDVLHPLTNEVVKIREGRFDMQYTN